MSAEAVIRIVLVDDQPLIRQGFAMILGAQDDLEVVGEAADGEAALVEIDRVRPDVVLLDVRMPGMDGIEVVRRLTASGSTSRVLMVTTFGEDAYVTDSLAAGATGFVLKDATPEELARAVRVTAAGEAVLSPAVTTRLLARMLPTLQRPAPDDGGGVRHGLTGREVEVLLAVARGRSNAEIAGDLFISETTVKTHISHVLTKLGLRDRVQAVVAAYELGLLTPGEGAPNR